MDATFPMAEKDALNLSALSLAYVGDAVHSLYIRTKLVTEHDGKPQLLHGMASSCVKASAQAELGERLLEEFTDTERSVYMRGRNGSAKHRAKNQTPADYRKATGLEAVLGYLYLTGQTERLKKFLETQL